MRLREIKGKEDAEEQLKFEKDRCGEENLAEVENYRVTITPRAVWKI